MHALKWIVLAIALFQGGWFVFDSSRALIVGDYITPASGPYAGRLGPWAKVISALGLEPRSTIVKCGLLVLGLAWLVGLAVFATRPTTGWGILLGCAVASLWYLPTGTLTGLIVIVLLLTPSLRNLR